MGGHCTVPEAELQEQEETVRVGHSTCLVKLSFLEKKLESWQDMHGEANVTAELAALTGGSPEDANIDLRREEDTDSMEKEPEEEAQPAGPKSEWNLPAGERLTVLMFGMTGAGKSSLGNCIAGKPAFQVSDSLASVTNLDSVMRYEADDKSLVLLDSIGLGDTEMDQDKVVASIRDMALSAPDGIDVLFFVMKNARLTDDAIARMIYVTEYLWGNDCLLNLYIVVTCAPRYAANREDALEWIEKQKDNWRFMHIYKLVGCNPNRFIFVDNPDPESGEPNCAERQAASRTAVMKALSSHARDVIPAWTSARMKDAQEKTVAERQELKQREEDVRMATASVQAKKKRRAKRIQKVTQEEKAAEDPEKITASLEKNSASAERTRVTAEDKLGKTEKPALLKQSSKQSLDAEEKDLKDKVEKLKKAESELAKKLRGVREDAEFKDRAVKEAELATRKFVQQYRDADDPVDAAGKPTGPVQAAKRLMTSLVPKAFWKKKAPPKQTAK
eukprot:TRINITY_DN15447_c0_g1_i1.p1 TRINITY_DN15447_c0_g1~~TRINITY_DN15447_c0_g1_i1.p1  ORF type:complete len:503 (-),score=143.14 TRINITY_DN15447_c0_g1_i1:176-1684(-)